MGGSPVLSGALVAWQGLFSDEELDAIVRLGDGLALEKAELSGGGQGYDNIRATQVAWVPRNSQTEMVYGRLEDAVLHLNARFFRFDLSGLAMFQYALYGGPDGGHFDWHKDYGRDPADPAQEPRKVTLSLQLSDPSDYKGCELQVRAGNQIDVAPKARGSLSAFPANVLHQVTPIQSGIRRALVVWAVGPEFR
ncbi:MAG TPA: 2OG-Fe(II) oxygenase [Rhizomicrobium sp.]|jgi:PKHD-type hydroxylase|nr:2OG-Fe(II) oxygenase [Rhizomicrobium sp.]